jgi:hypothetical protein
MRLKINVYVFFSQYIIKRGCLDGQAGFIFCVIMAWGVFLRYARIKELLKEKEGKA